MATLEQLQNALVKADAAGNVEDARAFANEIRAMRTAAPVSQPTEKRQSLTPQKQTIYNDETVYDPVTGVPISSGGGGESAQGLTGTAGNALGALVSAPAAFSAGASKVMSGLGSMLPGSAGNYFKEMGQQSGNMVKGMGEATNSGYVLPAAQFAGEVTSVSPAGRLLAAGASKVPVLAKNAPLIEALRTGGMSAGKTVAPMLSKEGGKQLAAKIAGGTATGAATAGALNPEDVGLGALVGGGLPIAGAVVRGAGNVASKVAGGMTGAGDEALQQALRAGQIGGDVAETFTKNMRGGADMTDVLDIAKSNISKMNADKQAAYRADMSALKTDKTVLDFGGIDNSVKNALDKVSFKGQVKNEGAANYLSKAQAEIDNWKKLDPNEFHTAEGLDALKQKVGDILESIPFEQKTARSAVGDVYNGIKTEIKTQAPKYADTMKAYQEASELTKEIERSLSLGNRASADTAMRKLQSLMRNNVSTNYGNRLDLAGKLEAGGGQEILPAIAGQALNSFTPRGLQGLAATGLGGFGLANPATLAALPLTSPRLMGEAAYGLGKLTRPNSMANALRKGAYRGGPVIATGNQ